MTVRFGNDRPWIARRAVLLGAAGLAGNALLVACGGSSGGDPESVARAGFSSWAKGVTGAYRNVAFKTTSQQEGFATVVVTAEFQDSPSAPWIEKQATVRLARQGNAWQTPTDFSFSPSPKGAQTVQAISGATAAVRGQQATATASVEAATSTAVRSTQTARATGTAAVEDQQAKALRDAIVGTWKATGSGITIVYTKGNDYLRTSVATLVFGADGSLDFPGFDFFPNEYVVQSKPSDLPDIRLKVQLKGVENGQSLPNDGTYVQGPTWVMHSTGNSMSLREGDNPPVQYVRNG
jgi:hypothetical protein